MTTDRTQSFLNANLFTVVIFLAILSTMLLYSLMLSDVDGKTYEYGMLRALGFKKNHLVRAIIMKSLAFSVPGLCFGLLVALIINVGLRMVIFLKTDNYESYELTPVSIIIGTVFGLTMPLISNYFPIQRALGKNLRNSLDLNRRSKDEVGIKVEKLEDVGISVNQLIVSVILIVVGFSCYYLVPYSLFKQKYTLVFLLLNMVLILIIIGLTFICILVFEYLESLILWLAINSCCRCDKRLHHVISKNMEGHRPRNTKTSLMFTLAISFLIFSASSFHLTSSLVVKTAESYIGADLKVFNLNDCCIDEVPIAEFLTNQQNEEGSPVLDFSFVTASAAWMQNIATDNYGESDYIYTEAESHYAIATTYYGVPANLLDVTFSEFYIPKDLQDVSGVSTLDDGKVNAVGLLYSDKDIVQYPTYPSDDQDAYNIGRQYSRTYGTGPTENVKLLLSSGLQQPMGIEAGNIVNWQAFYHGTVKYRSTVRGLVTKFPGFTFSGLNTIQFLGNTALMSMDQFEVFLQDLYNTNVDYEQRVQNKTAGYTFVDNIPKGILFVKLNPDISDSKRIFISNGIRNFFRDQTTVMLETNDVVKSFNSVSQIFNIFIAIIASIALFIAFFLLLVASTQNVNDAIWEYGVLRSMGLTKGEGMRIYIYEAYIVVISAAILGTIVGFVTAMAVAVQFYSFIELPVVIDFPWVLFGCMIGLSLITVLLAVCMPVAAVNRRQIASVLKGNA